MVRDSWPVRQLAQTGEIPQYSETLQLVVAARAPGTIRAEVRKELVDKGDLEVLGEEVAQLTVPTRAVPALMDKVLPEAQTTRPRAPTPEAEVEARVASAGMQGRPKVEPAVPGRPVQSRVRPWVMRVVAQEHPG